MSKARKVIDTSSMRRFKPYPTYKDSDVDWLGDIPENWEVKRLKLVAALNPTVGEVRGRTLDTEVSFVPMEAVGEYGGLDLSRTKQIAEVGTGYTYFSDGDVVVAKITPCFENGKGAHAVGLTNGIAFGTTELHVLRATKALDDQFLFYISLSDAFRRLGKAEMYGAGGQKRVPEAFIENFRPPLPSITEQRNIVVFLDQETAKIDELVAKKERVIELLQEKRSALITKAVTKGLDPKVPMKDSGVEWLGRIPAHWEIKRFKYLLMGAIQNGLFKKKELFGSGTLLVNVFDVYRDDFLVNLEMLDRVQADEKEQLLYAVKSGDIFFVRSSLKLEGVGRSACMDNVVEPTVFECHLVRARPNNANIESKFIINFLNSISASQRLVSLANTVTMATIPQAAMSTLEVPVPPGPEQRAIILLLDREMKKIDTLIAKVREAIERLKEYRTAMISAAVTGKIEVREEVG